VSRLSKMTIHRAGPVYSLVLSVYTCTVRVRDLCYACDCVLAGKFIKVK